MRRIIRLTESDLYKVIKESASIILEGYHRRAGEFYVIKQLRKPVNISNAGVTKHWGDRGERLNAIHILFARKPTSLQLVGGIANSLNFINYYFCKKYIIYYNFLRIRNYLYKSLHEYVSND